ncbi:hypothetical protein LAWI1_G008421 [Lachnellula willkommii]|uniref:Heterokaryon incompatibility domain-containing protein n=1 Tax=Lachnellula willkommii TaxID=215461 RepID=A0A559M2D0_9HELO|nr:hypothetical protein LAWI1_G008421 [Lachnellula willkommii]
MCRPVSFHVPTRLIEVGSLGDTEVRLVETMRSPQDHYLALSYCWGSVKVVKTTLANYEAMKRGMQVSSIPKTIQDAIKITRRLKQRYLWVDAICIIQDSVSDWETESGNMASIYRDAHLTLAAATSGAATEGFLHYGHLAAEQKLPFWMEWKTHSGQQSTLGARIVPALTTHTPAGDDPEDSPPLSLRGWTLQERGLQNWYYTVSEYTSRALTNPLDMLPAISGIARVVQDITNSQYIAGLWLDDFIFGLTWRAGTLHTINDSSAALAFSDYRAPTFSWASVERAIYDTIGHWFSANSCTVIETESKVPGRNPLGQVQSASVTLRGLIFKTTLQIEYSFILIHDMSS